MCVLVVYCGNQQAQTDAETVAANTPQIYIECGQAGGSSHVHLLLRFNVQVSVWLFAELCSSQCSSERYCQTSSVCVVATYRELVDGKEWGFKATRGEFNVVSL
jgi:hypothetical protein